MDWEKGSVSVEFILKQMLSPLSFTEGPKIDRLAIFVNKLIFQEFVQFLKLDYVPMNWDHELQIGKKQFHMKLVIIEMHPLKDDNNYFTNLINTSQFSMPWRERLTLFSDSKSDQQLEEFIDEEELRSHIVSVEDQAGPTVDDKIIKVITFNDDVDKADLIKKFGTQIKPEYMEYFFVTLAFPWLQPHKINEPEIARKDARILHSVISLILNHLNSIVYENNLDIFDLLSLKLALCDFPIVPNHLSNEIDYFLSRQVQQTMHNKYLVDNIFELTEYLYDNDFTPSPLIRNYFIYEYQNNFDNVRTNFEILQTDLNFGIEFTSLSLSTERATRTILLKEHADVSAIVASKANTLFTIDGTDFREMSFNLFSKLLDYDNIRIMEFDTDFHWLNTAPVTYEIKNTQRIKIKFVGDNTARFIENFVSSLKTISYPNLKLHLIIKQPLHEPLVFDNFACYRIKILNQFIDTKLLDDLKQSNLSQTQAISYHCSTIENNVEIWDYVFSIKQLEQISLIEDEFIWQQLFDFIEKRLKSTNLDSLKFDNDNCDINIELNDSERVVDLDVFTFRFDEFKTKIEILDEKMQLIELYDIKRGVTPEHYDKCNFEFYQ